MQLNAARTGSPFKETMKRLGIDLPRSEPAYSVEEAEKIAQKLGYPVVIRPAYTMGGTGGGLVYNVEELRAVANRGIAASMSGPDSGGRIGSGLGRTGAGSGKGRQKPDDHRLFY